MSDVPLGVPPAGNPPNMEQIPNANLAPSAPTAPQEAQPQQAPVGYDNPQEHQNPRGEPDSAQWNEFQQFLAWKNSQHQGAAPNGDVPTEPTQEPEQPTQEVEPTELVISNNPVINESLGFFLAHSGYSQETLSDVLEAIRTGNADGLDEAAIAQRVGAENAKHLVSIAKANAEHVQQELAGYRQEAHNAAGGEKNWTLVKQYVQQQASPAERAYIDHLWESGKERESVQYAIELAKKAGAIQVGKPFTGSVPTSPAPRGITAQEHTEQRNALFAKYGRNTSEADPRIAGQLQALGKQRELGRSSGI